MSGYNLILEIERLKEDCDNLGFRLGYPKHGNYRNEDVVALYPKDSEALPIYSRDAELFVGTISELKVWLRGLQWARNYDKMLMGAVANKRRERKEQDWRNRNLVNIIKESN